MDSWSPAFDYHSDGSEGYAGSDAIDSDIEVRLYASIHHAPAEPDLATTVGFINPNFESNASTKVVDAASEVAKPQPPETKPEVKSEVKPEVIVISDSDTDSEARSKASPSNQNLQQSRNDFLATLMNDDGDESSSSCFSLQSLEHDSESQLLSSSEDSDDDSQITRYLRNQTNSQRHDIKLSNVRGANSGLSKLSLSQDMKDAFDDDSSRECLMLKPRKNALNKFLEKCKSGFEFKPNSALERPKKRPRETKEEYDARTSKKIKWKQFENEDEDSSEENSVQPHAGAGVDDPWHVDVLDLLNNSAFERRYFGRKLKCIHCGIFTVMN